MLNINFMISISQKQALQNIVQFIPQWKDLNEQDLKLERLSGLTNQIYKVSHANNLIHPSQLIYRKLGICEANLYLNRAKQNKLTVDISLKCGPKIYGYNEFLRLEQYLKSHVLKTVNMTDKTVMKQIAYKVKQFQQIITEDPSKISLFEKVCGQQKYLKKIAQKIAQNLYTQHERQILLKTQQIINQQINWIQDNLKKLNQHLVFCHNDLLPGNVLIMTDRIEFIDFEYSTYNYDTYDLANYLNQSLISYDVSEDPYFEIPKLTPTDAVIEQITSYYLIAVNTKDHKHFEEIVKDNHLIVSYIKENKLEADLNRMIHDIKICIMLSNFYWGVWAIYLSKTTDIKFNYVRFAEIRLKQFVDNKQKFKF